MMIGSYLEFGLKVVCEEVIKWVVIFVWGENLWIR